MSQALTLIATNDNITIVYGSETLIVNRIKNKDTFEKVLAKANAKDIKWIENNITKIKDDLEMKTNGHFTTHNGQAVLKGTTIAVPEPILKKLMELEDEKQPILPLLKFWRKLSQNPSAESRKDLYGFMQANNIPITEDGDLVTEKGVKQNPNGFPGDLLDIHKGIIDNSIGSFVQMDRKDVDADRNKTCSTGLHVAAPDYVRKHWTSDVIVECIVNPKDVVSVPVDYSNTKMRVCAYRVAGFSRKHSRAANKVVKLSDFFTTPLPEQEQTMAAKVRTVLTDTKPIKKELPKGTTVTKQLTPVVEEGDINLESMSAQQIVNHVFTVTGVKITYSLKSKKSIVKKAQELLEVHKIKSNS